MNKSYPIKIWSGLLSDGHTQKIENALWEFIWLVSKVTKEEDGKGYVLRGTPVKVEDICRDLKRSYRSVYRHLQQLEANGYINMKKAPYGLIITVNNSKKFSKSLARNDKASLANSGKASLAKNGIAERESLAKFDTSLAKYGNSNKDIKDINKDIKKKIKKKDPPFDKIKDLYLEHCQDLQKILELSDKRKTHIRQRWQKYKALSVFEELFKKAGRSRFLTGDNEKNWKANFDWLINENNMIKVLEGTYDKKVKKHEDYGKRYRKG